MNINDSIQYLKGVGPKRAEAFAQVSISTCTDLIEYFPRRYLDRSNIVSLDSIRTDQEVTVIGKIESAGMYKRRRRIFYLIVSDGKGILEAVWFNRVDFYKSLFKIGEWVSLSGKVSYYRGYQMIHPDFDKLGDGDLSNMINTGKILPLYPSTENLKKVGLNSYSVRKLMNNLIKNYLYQINEILPENIVIKHGFLNRQESYRNIHFPESEELLNKSILRFKYEELFFLQLISVAQNYHARNVEIGISFNKTSTQLEELYKNLPFPMTAAQKRVVKEIRADMKSVHPMNRLLQGDVGSGKTLVALMAMLIAIDNGYQAAFMVPTEILAEQHYINISKALKNMNVPIRILTSNTAKEDRRRLLDEIKSNKPQIVIGTHALIQEDVDFNRLGLVIIDEQHRFGVLQRGALLQKGINADLLIMTATPIPRTLALTIYGHLDISIINEMPPGRKPVITCWKYDNQSLQILNFIKERVDSGEQVFIVFPLVEESEKLDLKAAKESYERLKEDTFKEYPIALLHGRLKSKDKEMIMQQFFNGKIKILVSTVVIEVGIDVPDASVMLIEHAERFGLSQLHQLRGRVGRGNYKSYCILKTPHNINPVAQQRMKIMTSTDDGFIIADKDLKLRGMGDFYGTKQHGFPIFKIANPILDQDIVSLTRNDAIAIVNDDPELRKEQHIHLRNKLIQNYSDRFKLLKIG
jgi:ATP-dependent DNA helicase RecG